MYFDCLCSTGISWALSERTIRDWGRNVPSGKPKPARRSGAVREESGDSCVQADQLPSEFKSKTERRRASCRRNAQRLLTASTPCYNAPCREQKGGCPPRNNSVTSHRIAPIENENQEILDCKTTIILGNYVDYAHAVLNFKSCASACSATRPIYCSDFISLKGDQATLRERPRCRRGQTSAVRAFVRSE